MTPADSIAHAVYWYRVKMDGTIAGVVIVVAALVFVASILFPQLFGKRYR